MTILVTRTRAQAPQLSRLLRQQGARVVEVPVIELGPPRSWRPLDAALHQLADHDWLVLTSANGVHALRDRMARLGIPTTALRHLKVAAIGPATRTALEDYGIRVALMPRQYVAESAAAALRKKTFGKRVLLVRAAKARDVLPRELRRAGAKVKVVAAYQTRVPRGARTQLGKVLRQPRPPELVTCTSSSTVQHFLRLARPFLKGRGIAFAAIGPVTAATLREHGIAPAVEARTFTMEGLVQAIVLWRAKTERAVR